MNASDLILAMTLLTSPVGTPETPPSPERFYAVRDAIHQKAIEWEIMDPRECRYFIAHPEEFQKDIDFLRDRYVQFKDAPRLADADQFPSRTEINGVKSFNRAFRKTVDDRIPWEQDRVALLTEVVRETDHCYRLWDAMSEAKADFHYVTYRRQALMKVKALWGEKDYLVTPLPPYVPDWRFYHIR